MFDLMNKLPRWRNWVSKAGNVLVLKEVSILAMALGDSLGSRLDYVLYPVTVKPVRLLLRKENVPEIYAYLLGCQHFSDSFDCTSWKTWGRICKRQNRNMKFNNNKHIVYSTIIGTDTHICTCEYSVV